MPVILSHCPFIKGEDNAFQRLLLLWILCVLTESIHFQCTGECLRAVICAVLVSSILADFRRCLLHQSCRSLLCSSLFCILFRLSCLVRFSSIGQLSIHRSVFRIHSACQRARKPDGSRRCQIHPGCAAPVGRPCIGDKAKILPILAVSRSDVDDQTSGQLRIRIRCHRLRLPVLRISNGKVRDVNGLIRAFRNDVDDYIAGGDIDCPVRCLHAVHRVGDDISRGVHIAAIICIQVHHAYAVRILRIRKRCREGCKFSQKVLRLLQILCLFLVILSTVSRENLCFLILLSIEVLCDSRIHTCSGKSAHLTSRQFSTTVFPVLEARSSIGQAFLSFAAEADGCRNQLCLILR